MLYSSVTFLFLFLPLALLAYYIVPNRFRNIVLLAASLFFYAWGSLPYVALLVLSVIVNYFFGRQIRRYISYGYAPTGIMAGAIAFNVGLLFVFKYLGSFIGFLGASGSAAMTFRNLAVPLGISFYTLQAISYLIEIYRGDARPQKKIVNFAVYLTLFPLMLAGPAEGYAGLEKQIKRRKFSWGTFGHGVYIFLIGLAKKVVLANGIGLLFSTVSSDVNAGRAVPGTAWVGVIAFMLQIYFNFSGYTDMAIGLAGMFGFRIRKNFNYPYTARSIRDFLNRWNLSVTRWFQEYLYVPLSGGRPMNVSRNVLISLIVWGIMGFWYGPSLTLVVWSLYCAVIMMLEKFVWGKALKRLPVVVQHLYSLVILLIGWVFFFSDSLVNAVHYLGTMFGAAAFSGSVRTVFYLLSSNWLLLVVGIICCTAIPARLMSALAGRDKRRAAYIIVMILLFILSLACLVVG